MFTEFREYRRASKALTLSSDGLNGLQDLKLQRVVRHAFENVPFYRALFERAGLGPSDIKGVEDLHKIPITTKADLKRAGRDNYLARNVDYRACSTIPTSGTSGVPFTAYLTAEEKMRRGQIQFRALRSIGFRPLDRLAVLGPSMPRRASLTQRLGFYRSMNISPLIKAAEQVLLIKAMRPTILWAYPTVLRALLKTIDFKLSSIAAPRILITGAEVFSDALKRKILADLDMETFNFYGANEVGRIAWECPSHEGLHVNSDHVVLESTKEGATVTALNAFAMPLIRYRLGDRISFVGKKCSCGLAFPLMSAPEGRNWDVVKLPDGSELSALGLHYPVWRLHDKVEIFRFTQRAPDNLLLEIVLSHDDGKTALEGLRRALSGYLGNLMTVDIEMVDEIAHDGLKFRSFVPLGGSANDL
jgi:phenylacetate-CoA ligase